MFAVVQRHIQFGPKTLTKIKPKSLLKIWTEAESALTAYYHQLIATSAGVANLGVVALLFPIGLEYDFERLLKAGPQAMIVANAGVVLSDTKQRQQLLEEFETIAGVLVPIFLIVLGAKTDLSILNPANPKSATGLGIAVFLIVIAVLGKVAASYLIPRPGTLLHPL